MPDLSKAAKPLIYIYDGPLAAVAVKLPTGRVIECALGESVEIVPSEVDAMENAPGWARKTEGSNQ